MVPTLQTSRLVLRPLELADAEQAQILFPHWEIVRYLANVVPWPYPPDGAYTYYRDTALPAMDRGDAWHWTLRLRSDAKSGQENDRVNDQVKMIGDSGWDCPGMDKA